MNLRDLLARINGFENGTNREGASVMRHVVENGRTAIADISESTGDMSGAERVKFNAVLAALRAKGLIDP